MTSASNSPVAPHGLSSPKPRAGRVTLMGVGIDAVTEQETVERILSALRGGTGGWVVTANLDQLRLLNQDPALGWIFRSADIITADGTTLVWASRLMGTPLPGRVAGSDLIASLTAGAAEAGASLFLIGGNPGTGEKAAQVLCRRYPGIRIAGVECPPFGFERDPAWAERLEQALRLARPDLVYVCLGFPKQEQLIASLRATAPQAWFLGLGISLSFVTGEVRRAPRWMQRVGLEWTHRLVQEPRRLFDRFVLHGIPFALVLFAHAAVVRATSVKSRSKP